MHKIFYYIWFHNAFCRKKESNGRQYINQEVSGPSLLKMFKNKSEKGYVRKEEKRVKDGKEGKKEKEDEEKSGGGDSKKSLEGRKKSQVKNKRKFETGKGK